MTRAEFGPNMKTTIATIEPLADDAKTAAPDGGRVVAQLRDRHWTMLWLSLAIIAASFLLQLGTDSDVHLAGAPGIKLPALCGSRALFGVECPGCGLTRSFVALARGDLSTSFHYHRLGWFVALVVVCQIPYRIYCLRELRARVPSRSWPTWFGYLFLASLVISWLLKASHLY
jgi:uncharacterized protein DUF2752